jgi:hypothetical protein
MSSARRRSRRVASAAVTLAAVLAACGSETKTGAGFATQLNDVCRTLDGAISGLPSASLDDIASSAATAGKAVAAAVAAAGKLNAPADVSTATKTFIANLGDEATLLGDIAAAAKNGDQATVDTKAAALNSLIGATTKVADEIGATRCAMDPMFGVTTPAGTIPVITTPVLTVPTGTVPNLTVPELTVPPIIIPSVTAPDVTIPNVTIPNVTIPNVTIPNVTIPNVTIPDVSGPAGTKTFEDIAASLTVRGEYALRPLEDDLIQFFLNSLRATPAMNAASGNYGGIQVIDTRNDRAFGRVFGFAFDQPLAPGSLDAWITVAAAPSPTRNTVIAGKSGRQFTDSTGAELFVVGDDTSGFFVIVGSNGLTLGSAVANFFASF